MLFYSYQPTYYVIFYAIQSFTKSLCHVIFYVISNIKCWHLLCVMVYQKLQWVSWIPERISQKHHLKKLISFSCFMFLEMLNGKRVKRKKKNSVYCSKLENSQKVRIMSKFLSFSTQHHYLSNLKEEDLS